MPTRAVVNDRDLELAKFLKSMRKDKGYTQEQLAEKVGVSITHYAYLELAYKLPNLHMLQKIADALGIRVKDLIPY